MARNQPAPAALSPPDTGWSESVGIKGINLVTVYERLDKKRMLYLRWSTRDGLQRESVGRTLPWDRGPEAVALAQHECLVRAVTKSGDILGVRNAQPPVQVPADPEPPPHPSAISLRAGLLQAHDQIYLGAARQLQHAKEQLTAIETLCQVFGDNTSWQEIPAAVIAPFMNARAQHHVVTCRQNGGRRRGAGGLRQAEKALAFLFQASRHLASQERMLSPIVAPSKWLEKARDEWFRTVGDDQLSPQARSLRYTPEERDALIAALEDPRVDPRLRVAVTMGSGSYRLGQVIRMKRTHVDPRAAGTPHGRMTIASAGKKKGGGYLLTEKELEAWEFALGGYLREFERELRGTPYPLFPGGVIAGPLPGGCVIPAGPNAKPLDIKTLNELWHQLEAVAGVERMPGRAWYGLRRANADCVGAAAARVGFARGSALDEQAVLLVTNHAFRMQRHYRAQADVMVDTDNLLLREELEKPQALYRKANAARPVKAAKRSSNRHPNRHPRTV